MEIPKVEGILSLWKELKKYEGKTSADEEIGYRAFLKYTWYLIKNASAINLEQEVLSLRRENERLEKHIIDQQKANRILQRNYEDEVEYTKALELKVDDLTQDMETLKRRLK